MILSYSIGVTFYGRKDRINFCTSSGGEQDSIRHPNEILFEISYIPSFRHMLFLAHDFRTVSSFTHINLIFNRVIHLHISFRYRGGAGVSLYTAVRVCKSQELHKNEEFLSSSSSLF